MSDPILTREQFDYAVAQAPKGLSREQFDDYLAKETARIHAGDKYGGQATLGQDVLEHKGVDTTKPPSPTMQALQHLAHPETASDFASLLIPEVPSVGRLAGEAQRLIPSPATTRAAARIGGKVLNGVGTAIDIIPGSKLGGTADVVRNAGAAATRFGESPLPNVLQGGEQFTPGNIPPRMSPEAAALPATPLADIRPAAPSPILHGSEMNEPGAIPQRLSPAAQPPARVPFRIAPSESAVVQGSEMFKPGVIPPRAVEAFGHNINPEPLQFGEHAEIMRNDYGPGALSSSTAPHIQIEPSEALSGLSNSPEVLSDLEKRMMKRPPSSPSAPIKEPVSAQAPEPVLKKTKSSSARGNTHSPNDLRVRVKLARLHPEWTADELDAGVMAERVGRNAQYRLGGQG